MLGALKYRRTPFEIFNLGENQTTTLSDLIASIENALGKRAIIEHLPEQQGDVSRVARLQGHAETFAATGMKVARPRLVYTSRRGARSKW